MGSVFEWDEGFLVDIEVIDRQHHRIVTLANELIDLVVSAGSVDLARCAALRHEMVTEVRRHFSSEEFLMAKNLVDPSHVSMHRAAHQDFLEDISDLDLDNPDTMASEAQRLADFLIHWLAHHILVIDKSFSRQLHRIAQGVSPAQALDEEKEEDGESHEPLMKVLGGLFQIASERNRDLRQVNAELERRVNNRTADLEKAVSLLENLSTHDDLTGLGNRRHAITCLGQLLQETARYGWNFAVLLIDADQFKRVNDTFGHDQGDEVIKHLASVLRTAVRESDIVCRMGGDEFLVICPHSTLESARIVAEKIRDQSGPVETAAGQRCWGGSVSIGIAGPGAGPAYAVSASELLKRADLALYRSKERSAGSITAFETN